MDTTIIDDFYFLDIITICSHDLCQRISQNHIPDMTEVEWFVGIWAWRFDEDETFIPHPQPLCLF
jgi:hypothetical protein